MQKSNIDWCEFTSNPVKGECPVDCSYCYVKPIRKRYGWHKDIRFYPQELEAIRRRKKPTSIFVGSTIELFHDKTIHYMEEIMETIRACPQHRFYLLTKQPQNLQQFSPFPDNCWVGVTATEQAPFVSALSYLRFIEAKVKYLSLEPLLGYIPILPEALTLAGISLVIIGAQTRPTVLPKIEWVEELVLACDKVGVKVFLKNNLMPLFSGGYYNKTGKLTILPMHKLRQELPDGA